MSTNASAVTAVTNSRGDVEYRNEQGQLHREDGPAVVFNGGSVAYWRNGKLHREGAPAIVTGSSEAWYHNGKRHREDGPAYIERDREGEVVLEEFFIDDKELDALPLRPLPTPSPAPSANLGNQLSR